MNKLSDNILNISELTKRERNFLFKRLFFCHVNSIAAWGILFSSITAWCLLFWLKPALVNSAYILQLLKDKMIEQIYLAELAVTGASAVTAVFVLLAFIALMMLSFAKKEKQYLQIIQSLSEHKNIGKSE